LPAGAGHHGRIADFEREVASVLGKETALQKGMRYCVDFTAGSSASALAC
jgi:hypothetical protein